MSTSDTHTTAASAALERLRNATSGPGNDPTATGTFDADGSGLSTIAKAPRTQQSPAAAPSSGGVVPTGPLAAAPTAGLPLTDRVSERIAHPVPRHHEDAPQDLEELLHPAGPQPHTGPSFRHMGGQPRTDAGPGSPPDPAMQDKAAAQTAATTHKPPTVPPGDAAPLGTAAPSAPAITAGTREATAVSGGFSPVNNWLDSLPEPEWHRIGDKIYASPASFKAWLGRARAERARATEARERTRLMDAAHAEALTEAAKRDEIEHAARFRAEQELAERQLLEQERQEQLLEQARAEQQRLEAHRLEQLRLEQQLLEAQRAVPAPEPNTVQLPAAALPAPTRTPADPDRLAALVASAKAAIDRQQALVEPIYVPPYTLPDTSPNPEATAQDKIRRLLFTLAAVVMTVASFFGIGGLVSGSVPGQYSLLSLAPAAYTLLPVISCWSLLASVYAWRPSQSSAVRQRAVGRTFPMALATSALWLVSVNAGSLFLAFCASAATTALLLVTVRELNRHTSRSNVERMLTDAPAGLMAGFFLVVSAAAFADLLQSWNLFVFPDVFAGAIVLGLGYVATGLSMTERGRIILASGFAWGMFWLLVPRLLGPNESVWVAILAGMAGFVVLLATENRRYQIHHAEHRAARGKRTEF